MQKTVAYAIGRFSPPHKGHILFLKWLLRRFDELIIGIGSCYEVGSSRHPLLAFFREKMLLESLIREGIDPARISFVHLQDFVDDWNGWWRHVTSIPGIERVTHFVTGNEEQIIGEMRRRNIRLPFALVNPENEIPAELSFGYHAKDLRAAIGRNDYILFRQIAASGTVALMGNVGGFAGIREALSDNGTRFVPGRQAVDLIVTCRAREVLCGYRRPDKVNFPRWLATPGGAIHDYESPLDGATREFQEETGLIVEIVARQLEPAHVLVEGVLSEMRFVGLFGTDDQNLGGAEGGSSQVFHIDLDVDPEVFTSRLKSNSDLEQVAFRPVAEVLAKGLAYQQDEMLRTALRIR